MFKLIIETLRICPASANINRICTEEITFTDYKDKKVTIEKGTVILLPVYAIHHDPEHYPNPEKFDPDRFAKENGGIKQYKDECVFLPFGDGPRICMGMYTPFFVHKFYNKPIHFRYEICHCSN